MTSYQKKNIKLMYSNDWPKFKFPQDYVATIKLNLFSVDVSTVEINS